MERDDYLQGIRGAWLGEQIGEALFATLAERSNDEVMRTHWQTLAQLEHVTGRRMEQILGAHGESTVPEDVIEIGEELLQPYLAESREDAMSKLKGVVEQAIVRFDQILAAAPEEDVPAVQFLVQHEQALLSFVNRHLAADPDHALDEVMQLLN